MYMHAGMHYTVINFIAKNIIVKLNVRKNYSQRAYRVN